MKTLTALATAAAICVLILWSGVSPGAELELKVVISAQEVEGAPHPLADVPVELIRKGKAVPRANEYCDDVSNDQGIYVCYLPCDEARKQRQKYGYKFTNYGEYMAPGPRTYDVQGCTVNPKEAGVRYRHYDVVKREYAVTLDATIKGIRTLFNFDIGDDPSALALGLQVAIRNPMTASDYLASVQAIQEIQKLSANLSELNHKLGNKVDADLYSSYTVTSTEVMLATIFDVYQPQQVGTIDTKGQLKDYFKAVGDTQRKIKTARAKTVPTSVRKKTVATLSKLKTVGVLNLREQTMVRDLFATHLRNYRPNEWKM